MCECEDVCLFFLRIIATFVRVVNQFVCLLRPFDGGGGGIVKRRFFFVSFCVCRLDLLIYANVCANVTNNYRLAYGLAAFCWRWASANAFSTYKLVAGGFFRQAPRDAAPSCVVSAVL